MSNQLNTATAYLIVLQTLDPDHVDTENAMRLLDRAVDARDFDVY